MITALIVDDELHNRDVLKTLLARHFPDITIVDEAGSAESAFLKINRHQPQLVFLDIKMPKKSGFALLKMFPEIDFEVVFVTAYYKYAIKAFEFNAMGYILKPIDHQKFLKTVEKVCERIILHADKDPVLHFVKTLSDSSEHIQKFAIHHNGKVIFIPIDEVCSIEAREDNTVLTLQENTRYYSSRRLQEYAEMLEGAYRFIRVSRSVMLNMDYIKSYVSSEPSMIYTKSGRAFEVSRRRRGEILRILKTAPKDFPIIKIT